MPAARLKFGRVPAVVRAVAAATLAMSGFLASSIGTEAAGTYRVLPVPLYRQTHGLSCEAAALQMALAYRGVRTTQNNILGAMGIDWRQPVNDSTGFHWGDPNTNFVGNPDGSEIKMTGYGTYWPVVRKVALQTGVRLLGAGGGIAPSTVYNSILQGHPVVVWVSFDWRWHPLTWYTAFDGALVPFGSPFEHAVTVVGVSSGYVLINNPWNGGRQQWIAKSTFAAAYLTFGQSGIIFR